MRILWLSSCKLPIPCLWAKLPQMRTKNHFKLKCRSTTPQVNTVEEEIEEFFRISNFGCGSLAIITMEVGKPSSQTQVTFQVDKGAKCNLLSLKNYQRVTGDVNLRQVDRCTHKFIKTYSKEWYRIMGSTKLSYGTMKIEMYCFSTLQKMTLHHCYRATPVLNWGL